MGNWGARNLISSYLSKQFRAGFVSRYLLAGLELSQALMD